MNQILDPPEQKTLAAVNLRKSLWICAVYGVATLSTISFNLLRARLKMAFDPEFLHGFVNMLGFVLLGAMLLSPLGFFFAMKAFQRHEGTLFKRIFHTVVHTAVFLMLITVILVFFIDIFSIYN